MDINACKIVEKCPSVATKVNSNGRYYSQRVTYRTKVDKVFTMAERNNW